MEHAARRRSLEESSCEQNYWSWLGPCLHKTEHWSSAALGTNEDKKALAFLAIENPETSVQCYLPLLGPRGRALTSFIILGLQILSEEWSLPLLPLFHWKSIALLDLSSVALQLSNFPRSLSGRRTGRGWWARLGTEYCASPPPVMAWEQRGCTDALLM